MPRVRRIVTSRTGGVSSPPYDTFNLGDHVGDDAGDVARNRGRLAEVIGPGVTVAWMHQVHGDTVQIIGSEPDAGVPDCDALVTSVPDVALAVLVADCVPVLLADVAAGVVGVAHAGREGVRRHVVTRTVEAMVELGATPEDVDVLLGPAICGGCYEVPAAMQAEVEAALAGSAVRTRRGTPGLDLRAGLYHQAAALGVARIGGDPRCTLESPDLYSHRGDGRTGRQAAITWLDPS